MKILNYHIESDYKWEDVEDWDGLFFFSLFAALFILAFIISLFVPSCTHKEREMLIAGAVFFSIITVPFYIRGMSVKKINTKSKE